MQLPEFSPDGFNLNEVVTIPDNDEFYPQEVRDAITELELLKVKLLKPINDHLDKLLEGAKEVIEQELERTKELQTIEDKNNEVKERLEVIVTVDDDFKLKTAKAAGLISELLFKAEQRTSRLFKYYCRPVMRIHPPGYLIQPRNLIYFSVQDILV